MIVSWTRVTAALCGMVACALFTIGRSSAQFTTTYNVPPDSAPIAIGSNTQLNLFDGGVVDSYFDAGASDGTSTNVEVNIYGGFIGRTNAYHGSLINVLAGTVSQLRAFGNTVNIKGGVVGQNTTASNGATLNISGGRVGGGLATYDGSTINISAGEIGGQLTAHFGGTLNISGGKIGVNFTAKSGGTVNISGGSIGKWFRAQPDAAITILGDEYRMDGVLVDGLDTIGSQVTFQLPDGAVLTGTLADGTPFAFSSLDLDDIDEGTFTLKTTTLPPNGPAVIMLPGDQVPLGIRGGQTLVVRDGGTVGSDFNAGVGAAVKVEGGWIGNNFEAVGAHVSISGGHIGDRFDAMGSSTVNVTGGTVGRGLEAFNASTVNIWGGEVDDGLQAYGGSTVNIAGGTVGHGLASYNNSTVNISGGTVGYLLATYGNSTLNITGGTVGNRLQIHDGSTVNITGGSVDEQIVVHSGTSVNVSGGEIGTDMTAYAGSKVHVSGGRVGDHFSSETGSEVIISGGEYRLDGAVVAALASVGSRIPFNLPEGSVLSGTFADGTPFTLSSFDQDAFADGTLTLETVAIPATGPALITLPSDSAPRGIRIGQTLVINDGGTLGDGFIAAWGSTVNMAGGSVGDDLNALGSQVTISGGHVGEDFDVMAGSTVNITGGSVGAGFRAINGSTVNMTGGTIHGGATSLGGSVVNVMGGVLGDNFRATSDSRMNVSGGSIGGSFGAETGSRVILSGGGFRIDGLPINGFDTIGNRRPIELRDGSVLSGTLADGTPFAFSSLAGDSFADGTLSLEAAQLPPIGPSVITLPADPTPRGVREGQTLVVREGGIVGDYFNAAWGGEVRVVGGQVGHDFESVGAQIILENGSIGDRFDAFHSSMVNIYGGSIGRDFVAHRGSLVNVVGGSVDRDFVAQRGSVVSISGGSVGSSFTVESGSLVNIYGGTVGRQARTKSGSVVNLYDGSVGPSFFAGEGSAVNIFGGSIGDNFRAGAFSTVNLSGGSLGENLRALTGSSLIIAGAEFRLDGVRVDNPDTTGNTAALTLPAGSVLSGTLSDGTSFAVSSLDGDGLDLGTLHLRATTLPPIGPAVVTLPTDPTPRGVRAGQTLVVMDGGLVGDDFNMAWGSGILVDGGQVGDNFESVGSQVAILGGSVGDDFDAFYGSAVAVLGGSVGTNFQAFDGSQLTLGGGFIASLFAESGSLVNVGGSVVGAIDARDGSQLNVAGGSIGSLATRSGSMASLWGGDFRLDGVPVSGLDAVGSTMPLNLPANSVLTGTLADGTPFAFSRSDVDNIADDTLTLTAAALAPVGPSLVFLPGDPAPQGVRAGQTLVVDERGEAGDHFSAGWGSSILVLGGQVGDDFEAVHAQVTIADGSIGSDFDAYHGSVVRVIGGTIGNAFRAFDSSVVNAEGGVLANLLLEDGSTVNLSGSRIGDLTARSGSTVTFSGGAVGRLVASGGSMVHLAGGEFRLDGVPLDELHTPGSMIALDLPLFSVLSGTLADGTPFALSRNDRDAIADDTLTLEAVTPPSIGPSEITLPADPPPLGIREGQRLTVNDNGVLADHFQVGVGSTLVVTGGHIGHDLVAVAAHVTISGGTVGDHVETFGDSLVNVSGGSLGSLHVRSGSTLNISGGSFDGPIDADRGSTVNVFGGSYDDVFRAQWDSELNLMGTEFVLDENDITSSLILNAPFTINERDVTLHGVLADGSPFSVFLNTYIPRSLGWSQYFSHGATLTVTLMLPGDYNGDAVVDAADYGVWRDNLGDSVVLAGDTTRGTVTLADYEVWRAHFGTTSDASLAATTLGTVPEPASVLLLLLAAGCGWLARE